MKLERQRVKDAVNAAVGMLVVVGFIRWLLNHPFSQTDLPEYIASFVAAVVVTYLCWPAWIRSKPDQPA